jgi:hypothetical protein
MSRLLGPLILGNGVLMVRVTVQIQPLADTCEIEIKAEENFGFGSLRGARGRYQSRCDEIADDLLDELGRPSKEAPGAG